MNVSYSKNFWKKENVDHFYSSIDIFYNILIKICYLPWAYINKFFVNNSFDCKFRCWFSQLRFPFDRHFLDFSSSDPKWNFHQNFSGYTVRSSNRRNYMKFDALNTRWRFLKQRLFNQAELLLREEKQIIDEQFQIKLNYWNFRIHNEYKYYIKCSIKKLWKILTIYR